MSFFYQREPGPEGQIISGEGEAEGVDLATLVEAGPLPVRVALELVAYVADIATIAEEDQSVHGDLGPNDVKIDPYGAVSVEGYGVARRGGRAPEGRPAGVATDVYGMGALLVTALSGESLGPVPRDRDGHDEAIVQRLLSIDWKQLQGKRWLEDLLRFLSAMFSFAPEERPAPLDVANVVSHVAGQAGGDDLATWAVRAVRAAGGTQGRQSTGTVLPQEDLGGPQTLGAPMTSTQAIRVARQAASAKGQSTAMWSRDRIQEMLAEEDEEELKKPIRKDWRPDDASRPRTRPEEKPVTRPGTASIPPREPGPPPVAARATSSLPPTPAREQRPSPPPPPPPPVKTEPPRPPVATSPVVSGPVAPPPSPFAVQSGVPDLPPPAEEAPKSNVLKYAIIGLVVLGVLCLGGGGAAWLAWQKLGPGAETKAEPQTTTATTPTPTPTPVPEPEPVDTGKTTSAQGGEEKTTTTPTTTTTAPKTETPPKTETAPKTTTTTTTTPKTTTSSTSSGTKSSSTSSTKSSTKASTKTTTTTTPKATTSAGPYAVKFVARDVETTLQCGDGQQSTFVGTTRMTFSDVTTCRVKMGAAMGVVQISANGTFTCAADASNRVTCSGS